MRIYGQTVDEQTCCSPAECVGCEKYTVTDRPDLEHISTSHVERQNLTMPMSMRRFTRLKYALSKLVENHAAALALHFRYHNFVRVRQTLKTTPAIAAGVTAKRAQIADVVAPPEVSEAN